MRLNVQSIIGLVLLAGGTALSQPSPDQVYAWFMADRGVTAGANGRLIKWQNVAASGIPADRDLSSYGTAPVQVLNGWGANTVIRFDGTNNIWRAAGNFGTLSGNRTIFAVLRLQSADGFLFDGSTGVGMTRAQIRGGTWQAGLQPSPSSNGGNADPATLPATLDAIQIHKFTFEPLASGTRVTHCISNSAPFIYTNSVATGLGGLILGQNVSQARGLPMELGEFMVFDRTVDGVESGQITDYLASKWQSLPPLTPSVLSATNIYAWYAGDTSLVVGSDNYMVSRWNNLGKTSTNATLTAAGRDLSHIAGAPEKLHLLRTNGAAAGALRLNGTSGLWAAQADFGSLTGGRTLVCYLRVHQDQQQGFLFDSSSYTTGLTRAQVNGGNWQVSAYGAGSSGSASAAGRSTALVLTNTWQVHSFVVDTNGGGSRIFHYTNGVLAGTGTNTAAGALGGMILGLNASAVTGLRADIAEALVYNSTLDDPSRTEVESYLSTKWSGVIDDPNAPPRPNTQFVSVFTGGQDGYTCYRIPLIITTTKGTVIAATDGRIGGCGDIPTPLDLVCKRSFDNGNTWGPLQIIANYGSDTSDKDTYPFYGATNINRVSAGDAAMLVDRTSGRIWTLYDNGGVLSGARKIKLEMRFSDDDGATWSQAIDVERTYPGIRPAYGEFLTGPGNGIQLESGPNAGRLIFPVYIYGSPSASYVIYSDDHGLTWQASSNNVKYGGESQVAELPGGELLASIRDNGFSWAGVRTFARSADGGVTWGAAYTSTVNPPTIPDPQCQGNILRLTTTNDSNKSRLIHANAASASSRVNMTLRISYDEGVSWPVNYVVYAGGSAYSSITKLANGDVGLLFEKDPYGSLAFVRISVADISGGTDSLSVFQTWSGDYFTPAQLMDPGVSGPKADPDNDGLTNEQECKAGTNPADRSSTLKLELKPGSQTSGGKLEFDAVPNKLYNVETTDLSGLGWQVLATIDPEPVYRTVQLDAYMTNQSGFFRIVIPN